MKYILHILTGTNSQKHLNSHFSWTGTSDRRMKALPSGTTVASNTNCEALSTWFKPPTAEKHWDLEEGCHFPEDIFKRICLNENVWIFIKISLKFVPRGPINNIPSLVYIMAWRLPGDKALSEPMMLSVLTQICITRPQWVKMMALQGNPGVFPTCCIRVKWQKNLSNKIQLYIFTSVKVVSSGSSNGLATTMHQATVQTNGK